jgi:hypothetical protein
MIQNITFTHLLTATMLIETFMLFLFRYTHSPFSGKSINNWYDNMGLVAVLLDITSVLIGFYLAKFMYEYLLNNNYINAKNEFVKYLLIILCIQIFHDFAFYFTVIKNTKPGVNRIIDELQSYASHISYGAVIGDSFMYLLATPVLYYFVLNIKNDSNIFISIVCSYLIGYFLYQKPVITM